ncbi:MAG: DUF539 domain-containing protein [Proteobacteria bacterium]|nr:DUF539 domain-containing protein [Pseudomonadota bacterium]MCP4920978.1 DUF539 domain-containing protein [Pseudomonadota bacterium]
MTTMLLALGLVAAAMTLMAAGVIFSDRKLKGSCGGEGGEDCVCEIEKRRECHANKQLEALMARKGLEG